MARKADQATKPASKGGINGTDYQDLGLACSGEAFHISRCPGCPAGTDVQCAAHLAGECRFAKECEARWLDTRDRLADSINSDREYDCQTVLDKANDVMCNGAENDSDFLAVVRAYPEIDLTDLPTIALPKKGNR